MKRPPAPEGEIVHFPPLPRIPPPSHSEPDPRQRRTIGIVGRLSAALAGETALGAGANVSTGYRASAVDMGRLKDLLERGLKNFTIAQIRERESEVFPWINRVLRGWAQRRKASKITIHEAGLRIEMQTQDDHGYYDYAFDVFPGRKATHTAPRRSRQR